MLTWFGLCPFARNKIRHFPISTGSTGQPKNVIHICKMGSRQIKVETAKNTGSNALNFPQIQVFLGAKNRRIVGVETGCPTCSLNN